MKESLSPQKKRIALIARNLSYSSPLDRLLFDYVRVLSGLGFNITILSEKCDKELLARGGSAILQGVYRLPLFSGLQENFFAWRCQQILAGEKFDFIVSQGDWADTHLSFALDFDVAGVAPSIAGAEAPSPAHATLLARTKNLLSAKCVVLPSQMMKKSWLDKVAPKDMNASDRVEVCYPGYTRELFNVRDKQKLRATGRESLRLTNEDLVIGLVTHTSFSHAGLARAIEMFRSVRDTGLGNSLKFVGVSDFSGDAGTTNSAGVVDETGMMISYVSKVLPAHYHALDIMIQPSLPEGFGQAALEAMACGLPVLLPPQSGTSELIQSKQLVVSLEDKSAWSQNLGGLITNRDWARSIAKQNAERALLVDDIQFNKRFAQIVEKHF